ncbi:DUF819 domain-containing protein [Nonlabens ulvanivorans]|nr:DUF819 domain-containing protein [Nonlabens ulvanivorans]
MGIGKAAKIDRWFGADSRAIEDLKNECRTIPQALNEKLLLQIRW